MSNTSGAMGKKTNDPEPTKELNFISCFYKKEVHSNTQLIEKYTYAVLCNYANIQETTRVFTTQEEETRNSTHSA